MMIAAMSELAEQMAQIDKRPVMSQAAGARTYSDL
jgi:hypothetical protein